MVQLNFGRALLLLTLVGASYVTVKAAQPRQTLQIAKAAEPVAPSFEVASIKPDTSDGRRMMLNIEPSGRFRGSGVPIKLVMEEAYGVKDAQIIGAPGWLASEKYDIEAKPDEATAAEMRQLTPEQRKDKLMLMLRGLLMDRCKLTLRNEKRDMPVYSLVVGKNGPKFHEAATQPADPAPPEPDGPKGKPQMRGGNIRMMGRGQLNVEGVEMTLFADALSRQLGRPVVNNTGLTGKYDFALKWTPDENEGQMFKGAGADASPVAPPAESAGPSIFTAVQEQLGLRLEAQKSAMSVLVIDHIEKPSAN